MEIAPPDSSYVSVRNPAAEESGIDGSSAGTSGDENNDAHRPTQLAPLTKAELVQFFAIGIIAASPLLVLIILGAKPSFASICIYVGLLQSTSLFVHCEIKSGAARWFLGFFLLFSMSSWKSGVLLSPCEDMRIKAVLYALTALWECSNVVLILGGKDLMERYGITSAREMILYSTSPCQVKFVHITALEVESQPILGNDMSHEWCTSSGKSAKTSIHILLCLLGVWVFIHILLSNPARMELISSYILIELECLTLLASMSVVLLDIPSHLWQLIYDLLGVTPLSPSSSSMHNAKRAKVILPYGCVYSSTSTREFWSRWSRPATQLIRYLFYHPLGGRNRWYISIPVMFLLNASSHFDLSYAVVGERSEVYWLMLFGTLAGVAILEVVGDQLFSHVDGNGNTSVPSWYWWTRAVVTHTSLRLVLYIMVHLCFKSSLSDFFPINV